MQRKNYIIGIIGIALILLFALLYSARGSDYPLTELGVEIHPHASLSEMKYRTVAVEGVTTILFMQSPSIVVNNLPCDLGIFYTINKNIAATSAIPWTEERLKAYTVGQGDTPPQVKEFDDIYFVFEPNQSACALDGDMDTLRKEGEERLLLWKSVSTAEKLDQ